MKSSDDLSSVMKFANGESWRDDLGEAIGDHLGPAMAEFELDHEELAEVLGEHWISTLWGCAFEDLATRILEPDGRNLIDDYLKRRGWKETAPAKAYMRALQTSVMSLYEVSGIDPGQSLLARDLIRGGDPIKVIERTASKSVRPWERIAVRLVTVGGRTVISGALLPFTMDAAEALLTGIRKAAGKRSARAKLSITTEILRDMAPLVTTAWLYDVLPKMLSPQTPVLHNSDGDLLVFHRARFPFAPGTTAQQVRTALDGIHELHRASAKTWTWLRPPPKAKSTRRRRDEEFGLEVSSQDGGIVLGSVELIERGVVLSVNSAERSARGATFLKGALGELIKSPLVEIETVEQMQAARRSSPRADEPEQLPPEVATKAVHSLLDREYRQTLDEPVGIIGGVSPRKAVRTAAGRDRVATWLKYLEHRSAAVEDRSDPMATYDFTWIWRELGIERLRQ